MPVSDPIEIKTSASVDGRWDGSWDEMRDLLFNKISTDKMDRVATAYRNVHKSLDTTDDELVEVGKRLAEAWKGQAATAMQYKLRQLWRNCHTLSKVIEDVHFNFFRFYVSGIKEARENADQLEARINEIISNAKGNPLVAVGRRVPVWRAGNADVKWARARDEVARRFVNVGGNFDDGTRSLGDIAVGDNEYFPDAFRADPVELGIATSPDTKKAQAPSRFGAELDDLARRETELRQEPRHPGDDPRLSPVDPGDPAPARPSPLDPGIDDPVLTPGTDLTSIEDPGFNRPGGNPGTGLGGGFGGAGTGAQGGSPSGIPGGLHGSPGFGPGGLGAGRGGAPGMPMMPMGGGAPGEGEERERTTWLAEDDDLWGGGQAEAPAVIE